MFAAERKRATWTRRCEEKLPKALSRLSYQVKDSEKFGLAKGNPDAAFTGIHPNFYPDTAPYLLTGVELSPTNPEVERGSGDRLPIGPEQALAKNSSDQALAVEKPRSSGQIPSKRDHPRRGLLI